jgi:photosystem II stability/assembly factor-like uncharacterized protein
MQSCRRCRCHDKRWYATMCIALIWLCLCLTPLKAQKRVTSTPADLRLKLYDQHVAMKDRSLFKNVPWQFLGPTNISGRMTDVAVVAPKGKHYTIYVAGASGGVWKTTNEGTTWEPIFEHAASTSIGDVTIAPTNPDIVWIGGGESNIFRSSMAGSGVYKSTDAGKTWQHMGLAGTHTIPRIIIHPENPDIVYVAASGHEWTDNEERGVYKTTDGGMTWEKVLTIDEKTGAIDLVMHPTDSQTLYASTWQRIRKKWNDPRNEPDYTGSGIFKTTDGGQTWASINNGLPEPRYRGRIGIDLCLSKPNVLYAFVDNYEIARESDDQEEDAYGRPKGGVIRGATVFRSDDGGDNWRRVSAYDEYMEGLSGTYGWVFGQIRVDPNDENTIYVMGVRLHVSQDGGQSFRPLDGMHVDHHGMWIDPNNSDYIVDANDGGVAISYDGGENWRTFYNNVPLVQFFNVMIDMDEPFHVYGSIQDHGSYSGIVDLSHGRNQMPAVEWKRAPGGEGSSHAIDPTDPNIVYSAGFYGRITRTDLSSGEQLSILPEIAEDEPKLRGQWVAPFIISPHNPRIIYHGMQYLYRSMDRGDSWERISPDLTYNDPKKLGDIPYQTIFSISESPLKFGLIYVGTDDGKVHVTLDGGGKWKEIMKGLPHQKWVSRIVASAYDEGTVYMSQNGKRDDDFAPYLWKSTNYGKTWVDITGNIPSGPINVIREDPKNPRILYVGTDLGVYISVDGCNTWHVLANNLPTTFVHDLVIHPRDDILVVATHGRGMWAMNVRPIQTLSDDVLAKDAHLFETEPAKLPRKQWREWIDGQEAYIHYYLKDAREATLIVQDEDGNVVNEIEGTGDAGMNVAVWDLTTKASTEEEPQYVEPGQYRVILKAGAAEAEGNVKVMKANL